MNAIIPVGNGFLLVAEEHMKPDATARLSYMWQRTFPGVPFLVSPGTRLQVLDGQPVVFSFEGSTLTPEKLDEFRQWWDARWQEHSRAIPGPPAGIPRGCDGC